MLGVQFCGSYIWQRSIFKEKNISMYQYPHKTTCKLYLSSTAETDGVLSNISMQMLLARFIFQTSQGQIAVCLKSQYFFPNPKWGTCKITHPGKMIFWELFPLCASVKNIGMPQKLLPLMPKLLLKYGVVWNNLINLLVLVTHGILILFRLDIILRFNYLDIYWYLMWWVMIHA